VAVACAGDVAADLETSTSSSSSFPFVPPPFSLPALRRLSRRIQARMQTAAPAAAPRHRVIMERQGGLSKTKGRSGPLTLYTRFRRAFFFSSRGHGQASSRSTTRCVWENCF